jgi:hypothetical protein
MKESVGKGFARFAEKNAEAIRAIESGRRSDLGMAWVLLTYIGELNGIYIYDTQDGTGYRENYEFERQLLRNAPQPEELFDLMKAAFDEDKPKSRQREEKLNNNMLFVEAFAAIPLVIDKTKKILLICKQLEATKDEVAESYVFDSYTLKLYVSVIRHFVLAHEQQRQLTQSKNLIKFGSMAAIAAGVLALLEGLSSTVELFKGASFGEVAGGLTIIGILVFLGIAIVQILTSDKPFGLKKLPISFLNNPRTQK